MTDEGRQSSFPTQGICPWSSLPWGITCSHLHSTQKASIPNGQGAPADWSMPVAWVCQGHEYGPQPGQVFLLGLAKAGSLSPFRSEVKCHLPEGAVLTIQSKVAATIQSLSFPLSCRTIFTLFSSEGGSTISHAHALPQCNCVIPSTGGWSPSPTFQLGGLVSALTSTVQHK